MNQEELTHSLRKQAIQKGHSVQTLASGYSMFPFLKKGDILTVEPVPMEMIKRGDVVVFERGEKWIAHRVIKIRVCAEGLEFLLRGDTCIAFDPVVKKNNYVGTVKVFNRKKVEKQVNKGRQRVLNLMISCSGLFYNFSLYSSLKFLRFFVSILKKITPKSA